MKNLSKSLSILTIAAATVFGTTAATAATASTTTKEQPVVTISPKTGVTVDVDKVVQGVYVAPKGAYSINLNTPKSQAHRNDNDVAYGVAVGTKLNTKYVKAVELNLQKADTEVGTKAVTLDLHTALPKIKSQNTYGIVGVGRADVSEKVVGHKHTPVLVLGVGHKLPINNTVEGLAELRIQHETKTSQTDTAAVLGAKINLASLGHKIHKQIKEAKK